MTKPSPANSPAQNVAALQAALDRGGLVVLDEPGVYDVNETLLIGGDTTLRCGPGVVLRKVAEPAPFTHVLLNRAALTTPGEGVVDRGITIENLRIAVNGVDLAFREVYGLRGQVAMFNVADLRITGFRCEDLDDKQFCLHICDFEDVLVHDIVVRGGKDGVHFGRGKRFTVSRGIFETGDDAVALNAMDYVTSNPTRGHIDDGLIIDCHDLPRPGEKQVGFFCRVLTGSWVDWSPGIAVRHSDTVIHDGKMYRVMGEPGDEERPSNTPPTHTEGIVELDGLRWSYVQPADGYTALVRRVTFRDITLHAPRVGIAVMCNTLKYNRGYYPGAELPVQGDLVLDNVRAAHGSEQPMLVLSSPFERLRVRGCLFGAGPVPTSNGGLLPNWTGSPVDVIDCHADPDLPTVLADVDADPRYDLRVVGA